MTKEGLSFGDEDVADVKKREKHYKKVFTPLAEHLKELFKGKISKVCTANTMCAHRSLLETKAIDGSFDPQYLSLDFIACSSGCPWSVLQQVARLPLRLEWTEVEGNWSLFG